MSGGIHAGGNDRQPENSNPERHQPRIDKGKMQNVEEEEVAKENSDGAVTIPLVLFCLLDLLPGGVVLIIIGLHKPFNISYLIHPLLITALTQATMRRDVDSFADDEQESPTNSFFKRLVPLTSPEANSSCSARAAPAVPDHDPADEQDSGSSALGHTHENANGLSLHTSHDLNTQLPSVPNHEPGGEIVDLESPVQASDDEEVRGHARRNAFGVGSLPDDLDEVHEGAAPEQGDGSLHAGGPIRSVQDTVNDLRATYSNSSGAPSTSLDGVGLENTDYNEHDDAAPVPSARLRFAFVVDPPVGQMVQPQLVGSTVAQQPPSGDEILPGSEEDDGGIPPLEAMIDDEGNIEVELDPASVEVLER
ncbi:hypothetical protein LTR97_000018 [Elasticomyces elasticus]|uniref:Uncharacterized protein n=1 Tax=Elasticomyces elasticus TaxID=574655 RepID=A0AAN7VXP6_9PEZI|nr:hypothetical protein LTR97_000018 [Elasticomyces elasticus]